MHPSELKNRALVAAARAEMDGFTATAEALMLLASACASEAQELKSSPFLARNAMPSNSIRESVCPLEIAN
jgi:hypothetical protein